ncbi:Isochorismatase hydrolase [Suillus subalutaceus]|uniref:Isochorismatase hydrolase n=1 Tax=Suillus subalutaceus TaxID=48586 RepID=UPI001B86BBC4|nr:Isochorismatase hydrolase [Suillus subalutaceus]KAG1842504.1 Isochorismatase hydrolase [Suillus subalutaceus]
MTRHPIDSHHSPHPSPQSPPALTCRVLLLLDLQVCMLSSPTKGGVPSSETVYRNIEHILDRARAAKLPPRIIHIRNSGESGDPDAPNSPGWQLVFPPLEHEFVVDKLKNNAFAGTKLPELIPRDAELIVVGMQSDYCVRATCSAALARGNTVILINEAHATYDRIEVWNGGMVTIAHDVELEIEAELEEAGVNLLCMSDVPHLFSDR